MSSTLDNILFQAEQSAINGLAGIAGTFGITLPSPGSDIFFTTGADHITARNAARVYNATIGGAGATLTAGDSLTGMGNTLNLTDCTGAAARDVLPAGVSLSGLAAISLTTKGNAGADAGHAFDLSGVSGLDSVSLTSSGTHGDFLNSGSASSVSLATHGVALASSAQALTLGGSGTIVSLTDGALGSLTVTGAVALGSATAHVALNATAIDLSDETGAAYVDVAAGGARIATGTGVALIDLGAHGNDTVVLNTDAAYRASAPTPNLVIQNNAQNDVLAFAHAPASLTLSNPASAAATVSGFIHDLAAAVSGVAGGAAYGAFNGDTYLVESANGALDAHDLVIVKLVGVHTLSANGATLTVDYSGIQPPAGGV